MCELFGLEIFLRPNDITRGWRSWVGVRSLKLPRGKQQIRHKRSNSPYGYQCKNRGFVLSLSKQYKTNKISTFPALFLCLYHLLSYSHWLLTICNRPTIPNRRMNISNLRSINCLLQYSHLVLGPTSYGAAHPISHAQGPGDPSPPLLQCTTFCIISSSSKFLAHEMRWLYSRIETEVSILISYK